MSIPVPGDVGEPNCLIFEPNRQKLTEEMVGVKCPVCHEEAFQLLPREAQLSQKTTTMVNCCPRCARRIDIENEDALMAKALDGMSKTERRATRQELSQDWARKLHGKKVIVHYNAQVPILGIGWSCPEGQVRGTAYHLTKYKWGCIKVVLDRNEHHRITHRCHEALNCKHESEHTGEDMYFSIDGICSRIDCEEMVHTLDGIRWGFMVFPNGEDFEIQVNWGDHHMIEEVDSGKTT